METITQDQSVPEATRPHATTTRLLPIFTETI